MPMHAVFETINGPPPLHNRPSVLAIKHVVSDASGVPILQMEGERRRKDIVRARHIAMFLAYYLTGRSYPEIARLFGGRHHTSVMQGVRKVQDTPALLSAAMQIAEANGWQP